MAATRRGKRGRKRKPASSRFSLRRFLLATTLIGLVAAACGIAVSWLYVGQLEAVLAEKLSGHRWAFPSRVYSDGFLIYPGLNLKAAAVPERLRRLGYREVTATALRKGDFRQTPTTLTLFQRDFPYPGEPAENRLVDIHLHADTVTHITDAVSGQELFSLLLEPELVTGLYRKTWEERREVSLAEVPPRLIQAILTTEDQRFFSHHGVDPIGILRAMWVNLRHGRIVQGGSTLTQQLMKNFFLSERRTWDRKLVEAAMALVAEQRYSKNEILQDYLNEIYLGQNGIQGIFGIWEASQFYFARTPSELSLAETAMLAGLIRAPNAYSPYRDPKRARQRRNTVLGLLLEAGVITQAEHDQAANEPLRVVPLRGGRNGAPYFVDYLREELVESYPPDVLTSEGLRVFTTLDVQLQRYANAAVAEGLADLESRYPSLKANRPGQAVQACLIAMQPQTGEVKAMVGGRDYGQSQFNRAIYALRQPGSVFKPFVYLAAFEQAATAENPITPSTILLDEPFEWRYDSRVWRPANYRDRYLGRVTTRQALELSLNSATARLAHRVGLDPIRTLAHRMGISSELPRLPSIVLGAQEVSPFEIARAYAVLANQGLRTVPRATRKVVDRKGRIIERHPVEMTRVTSPEAAYLVTHILEGVLDQGTGRPARQLGFDRPAAGKTGTTNEGRDAWFVGFTPNLLTVVWVGFDEGKRLGLTGSVAALPIWARFMKAATAGSPAAAFVAPPGVASVRIDPYTGGLATEGCPDVIAEAFWKGQEPTEPCPVHGGRLLSQAHTRVTLRVSHH